MPIDLSNFEQTGEQNGVTIYEREVETPLPANEDGSGYITETNIQNAYVTGDRVITVSKVTDRGWDVWAYVEEDDGLEIDDRIGLALNAQKAQRVGLQTAIAVSQS